MWCGALIFSPPSPSPFATGGADSASVAVIARVMCDLAVTSAIAGDGTVQAELARLAPLLAGDISAAAAAGASAGAAAEAAAVDLRLVHSGGCHNCSGIPARDTNRGWTPSQGTRSACPACPE